ncbi:hypothetical protein HK097_011374 [Rhizophlyctis rosea]|uniref:DUF1349 domain-containing protein n=1 Tax=Rhizophlyctis rosea TaxID=64517 RepID=A0AAD5X3T3_9FUNG|nr:hypothetical protein HK097_011374 [Rhizophlyctis rosea]
MLSSLPFSATTTTWHNPPADAPAASFPLRYHTPSPTDLWYTPTEHRDSAPTLLLNDTIAPTTPFTLTTHFRAPYKTLYDQAGLAIYQSPTVWLKAGVEFFDNELKVSTVVTNGFSDWSVQPYTSFLAPGEQPKEGFPLWVRAVRKQGKGGEVVVEASVDGQRWKLIRHCFGWDKEVRVGIMSAAPTKSEGFEVTFEEVRVEV